jgi:hypothetical protein
MGRKYSRQDFTVAKLKGERLRYPTIDSFITDLKKLVKQKSITLSIKHEDYYIGNCVKFYINGPIGVGEQLTDSPLTESLWFGGHTNSKHRKFYFPGEKGICNRALPSKGRVLPTRELLHLNAPSARGIDFWITIYNGDVKYQELLDFWKEQYHEQKGIPWTRKPPKTDD